MTSWDEQRRNSLLFLGKIIRKKDWRTRGRGEKYGASQSRDEQKRHSAHIIESKMTEDVFAEKLHLQLRRWGWVCVCRHMTDAANRKQGFRFIAKFTGSKQMWEGGWTENREREEKGERGLSTSHKFSLPSAFSQAYGSFRTTSLSISASSLPRRSVIISLWYSLHTHSVPFPLLKKTFYRIGMKFFTSSLHMPSSSKYICFPSGSL